METVTIKIDDVNKQQKDIARAAEVMRSGGLCAFPTETVYGLGACGLNTCAVSRIFEVKGRPPDNPLILHIADISALDILCEDIPDEARSLARRFWPGPLTMVLRRKRIVPDIVTAGLDTVAVRMPSHPVAQALIREVKEPIAAPSANSSGTPSTTSAAHVLSDIAGRVEYVLDAGPCSVGIESTVVAMHERPFRLLRPGGVTLEELRECVPEIVSDSAAMGEGPARSPGMKYRHYAPRAPITAVLGSGENSARIIREMIKKNEAFEKPAILCYNEFAGAFGDAALVTYGGENDYAALASGLFEALRRLDNENADRIYAQCPDEKGVGLAVANRIRKAAGNNVLFAGSK